MRCELKKKHPVLLTHNYQPLPYLLTHTTSILLPYLLTHTTSILLPHLLTHTTSLLLPHSHTPQLTHIPNNPFSYSNKLQLISSPTQTHHNQSPYLPLRSTNGNIFSRPANSTSLLNYDHTLQLLFLFTTNYIPNYSLNKKYCSAAYFQKQK